MALPERTDPRSVAHASGGWIGRRLGPAVTLLFVLAAVSVSAWLVVYTAWHHELWNGVFALLFAVLSAKAALLWLGWRCQVSSGHSPEQKA